MRVHPLFWLVCLIMGGSGAATTGQTILLWVGVVFVSILIHEMGHALAIRFYGWSPTVTLYGFGGLASYNPGFSQAGSSYARRGNSTQAQIMIAAAGPLAGFIFAGFIVAGLALSHASIEVFMTEDFHPRLGSGPEILPVQPGTRDLNLMWLLLQNLLFVNIGWGIVNLFPVYPLDGGKIAREIMLAVDPQQGLRNSMLLSIVAAVGVAIIGYAHWDDRYIALLFAYLAYLSYTSYQSHYGGPGGFGSRGPW